MSRLMRCRGVNVTTFRVLAIRLVMPCIAGEYDPATPTENCSACNMPGASSSEASKSVLEVSGSPGKSVSDRSHVVRPSVLCL